MWPEPHSSLYHEGARSRLLKKSLISLHPDRLWMTASIIARLIAGSLVVIHALSSRVGPPNTSSIGCARKLHLSSAQIVNSEAYSSLILSCKCLRSRGLSRSCFPGSCTCLLRPFHSCLHCCHRNCMRFFAQ